MTKQNYIQDVSRHLSTYLTTGSADDLISYLVAGSNLPGTRANLELARAFTEIVREYAVQDTDDRRILWNLCVELASIAPEDAPTGDPHEFLSFCGIRGIGAIGSISPAFVDLALLQLHQASTDPRWREREAVAMGVAEMLAAAREKTLSELDAWVGSGAWLPMRAAAAGIAEPDLLKDPAVAEAALMLHRKILIRVYTTPYQNSEEFRVLRKGLGYTLSVVVSALPDEGFEYLRQLASLDNTDIRWIVKENLKKGRLEKHFPDKTAEVRDILLQA
jgi:hypothetical protein